MKLACLDLESVLVPEIFVTLAEKTGIPELRLTTTDTPDFDKIMETRIRVMRKHGYGIREIREVVDTIDPFPGAVEFLDELRSLTQVVILSDAFIDVVPPLLKKLGRPTIFCNSLILDKDGFITGYRRRTEGGKLATVKAFQSVGCETIASGDSYNDLGMIRAGKAGFLFNAREKIKAENPDIPAYDTYGELLAAFKKALA